jgi:hypothetical protein
MTPGRRRASGSLLEGLSVRLAPNRPTVFIWMLAVAVIAIGLSFLSDRGARHAERCLEIADNHARLAANYREGAKVYPPSLRVAAWHDHMRRQFEQAADRPWSSIPVSWPFPPLNWAPPSEVAGPK